jgi:uncharacterized protein (UPF0333 family)
MHKRGQITLFLAIAVVMLVAFGFGFYYLIHSNDANSSGTVYISEKMSLDSQTDSVKSQVQSCLEKRTKEAIDTYGVRESAEEAMKTYIDSSIERCVDFEHFQRRMSSLSGESPAQAWI